MRTIRIVPFLAGAALIAMPAMAEMHGKQHGHSGKGHGKGKGAHMMMKKADKDDDGNVSRAEFMAFHADKFKQIDRDGDGIISRDEMMKKPGKMEQKRKHMMQNKQAE